MRHSPLLLSLLLLMQFALLGAEEMEAIRRKALGVLWEGAGHREPEVQLMTAYGAGIAMDERTLPILVRASQSTHPQIQLAAVNALSFATDLQSQHALRDALRSNYLIVRLQALHALALLGDVQSRLDIESLLVKVPEAVQPALIPLYARLGDPQSLAKLRQAMMTASPASRRAAILSSAQFEHDCLLPDLRICSSHVDALECEASAIALGCMRDAASVDRLVSYTKRGVPNLEVAASLSLVRLGREDAAPGLEKLAHAGNCYAIFALGEVSGSEDCLARLLAHSDLEIRVHAGLALLQRKDPRALPIAQTVLTDSQLDVAALPCYSPSGALRAWRVLSSAQQNLSSDPYAYELAIQSREQILAGIALLGEEHFLPVAEQLMAQNMNALIPGLIHLLEELNSPAAVELLQRHVHQPGAPLIRNYCKLALFRMGEAPQYRSDLEDWLLRESQHDIISFRPLVPWERHQNDRAFELTPTEKSRLLIECFETIAALQDEPAMRTLQKAMLEGDSLNRYALAGLLLRAST